MPWYPQSLAMASLGNPRTWVPYMNSKDCSQGFCSLYCPQWGYIVYPPPPPPPPFEFPDDNSSPNFSPLVIAIIGILASAFLLASYYMIISKYCGNRESVRRENHDPNDELEDNHNPSFHEPWHVSPVGLDEGYESIRRSISMDHSFQSGLSVANVYMNQEQDNQLEECSKEVGPSKGLRGENSKSNYRRRVMHCVLSPTAMKRSISSGRFSLIRNGRGRQGIIPV